MTRNGATASGADVAPPGPLAPLLMLAAVMAAFAASRLAIAGVPTEREYDEGVYLMSARAVARGHELFSEVFSSQPPAFLETLALAFRLAGDRLETGRFVIVGFSLLALAATADIARRIAGWWAAPVAAAALALSLTFCDLGHFVLAETPAVAVALLAMCVGLEARRRAWNRGLLAASGALLALAALFKLIVAPFAAPFGLLLLLLAASGRDETDWKLDGNVPAVLARALTVAAGAAVVLAVPLLVYDAGALYEQTIGFHLSKHDVYRLHAMSNFRRSLVRVVADWPMATLAVIGTLLLVVRRRWLAVTWLAAWLVLMLAVLVGQTPLFWRHFILISPPIVLAAGAGAALLAARLPRAPWAAPVLAVAFFLVATPLETKGMFPHLIDTSKHDRARSSMMEAVHWIRKNTHPEEIVGSDDPLAVYLSGRLTPPALCDTSGARIMSGSLTAAAASRETLAARVVMMRERGRLSSLPGFHDWLSLNYDLRPTAYTGLVSRRIWIRKASAEPLREEDTDDFSPRRS